MFLREDLNRTSRKWYPLALLFVVCRWSRSNGVSVTGFGVSYLVLCFDLLTRPKMPFKVMHPKEVTHSNGSYERKSRGRKLADEMGRGKKNPIILS